MKGKWIRILAVLVFAAAVAAALPVKPAHAAACTFTSNNNGSWNAAIWTIVGSACGTYPGETFAGDTVNIGHTVSFNVTPANTPGTVTVNSGGVLNIQTGSTTATFGALTINSGGTVTVYRDMTVNGATSVFGTINFGSTSSTNRTMTFTGDVTLNSGAVWNETATGAVADFTFGGSLTNNATTFTAQNDAAAVHTFSGAAKTLSGSTETSIPYATISGTYTNNGTLTVGTALSGTGGLTQGTNATLNIGGTSGITTLTATATGNTVNYTGAAQTAKVTTYYNLTLSGSLAKTFNTTPTVNGVLSMEGTATVVVTTGVVTYGASATLQYNTSTARTASSEEWISPFNGSGGVIIANTGAITLNAAKTLNQPLTVRAGATLNLSTFALGSPTSVAMEGGATTGASIIGSGTLTLGGNVTVNDAGTGTSGATISAPVALGATRTFTVNDDGTSATDLTISGIISGATFGVTKAGAGTMVFSGVNTYTGLTTVNAGTLRYGVTNALSSGGVTVDNGSTFDIVSYNDTVGAVTLIDGTIAGTTGVLTGASYDVRNGTVSAILGGTGVALTKTTAGTVILSGANTYTGATTVSAGILDVKTNTGLGTTAGTTSVTSGAVVQVDGNGLSIAEPITLNGDGISSGGALRNLANSNTWSGAITLTSASRINSDAGTLTLTGGVTGGFGLTIGGSGNTTVSTAAIGTGAGTVTKDGSGTLTLSFANTYTGLTTVNAGILRYGVSNALSTGGVTVNDGGTYDLNGFSDTIGALTVNSGATGGTVTTGAGTLTLGGNVSSTGGATNALISGNLNLGGATRTFLVSNAADGLTVSAIIGVTGAYGVTKTGNGTLTLSGANTYTGATTVSAGILDVKNNTALGTTAGTTSVTSGAVVQVDGNGLSIAEPITLNGDGSSSGGALRNLANNNTWSGAITLGSASRINSDAGTLTLTGGVTGAGLALTIGGSGNTTFSTTAIATGAGTVTKDGSGTLTMSFANSYTGGTTLNAGTLNINNAQALGTVAGTFTINGGAIDNTSAADITTLDYPLALNGDFTYSGSVPRNLDLGTGTVTMNADRQITVSAGTLTIGGTISAGTRTLTKAGAGTLSFGANAVTLNGLTISAGTLTSTSGTMSLAGDFTNNGTFTPNGGTVNFNGTTQTGSGAGTLNFYNLTIASGTTTFSRASTVGGALSISLGAVLKMGAYKVTGGTFTYGGPGTLSNNETKSVTLAGGTQTFLDGRTASSAQLTVAGGSNPGSTIVTTTIGTTIPASWNGTCSAQPAAVKRYYNITAGTNTGLDVTLRLYYDDLELNGIAENSISIYHCENGTWVWEPGIYSRDTTANWVQVTGVDSFSPFILSKGDPTSAELLSFRALGLENSINLRWEMASGANNLGFNVYRAAKVDGARTQVNEDLILSQVPPGRSDRASYQYTDITPELKAGGVYFYWLEMVDISGATRLYGPVELRLAK